MTHLDTGPRRAEVLQCWATGRRMYCHDSVGDPPDSPGLQYLCCDHRRGQENLDTPQGHEKVAHVRSILLEYQRRPGQYGRGSQNSKLV